MKDSTVSEVQVPLLQSEPGLDMTIPEMIAKSQQNDTSLKPWLEKAFVIGEGKQESANSSAEGKFILGKGILYQVKDGVEALTVAASLRQPVLTLGHAVSWAGHLGGKKTLDRISSLVHGHCKTQR